MESEYDRCHAAYEISDLNEEQESILILDYPHISCSIRIVAVWKIPVDGNQNNTHVYYLSESCLHQERIP